MRAPETCPLCGTPRSAGAPRCRCNYVFEYEAPPRGARSSRSPTLVPLLVIVALVGIVVGYYALGGQADRSRDGALAFLLVPAGAFSVFGSILDWNWFFGARKARLIVAIVGRTGARLVYAAIGGAIVGAGFALAHVAS